MPELPDLQVFSRNLTKKLHGKTIKKVTVTSKKANGTNADFEKALEGHKITEIKRVGKELHIECSSKVVLGLHLMLHGKLFLYDGENTNKYPIIDLLFTDDTGLVLTDYQGAATPTLNPEEKPAPDALAATEAMLKAALGKTRSAVKNVLLDQKVIRGIGNAYADEILWHAGIAPESAANKIPADKVKQLAKAIKEVLHNAEKQIAASNPDIISGEVRDFLAVHNTHKTHSPTGAVIKHSTAGGRKTYYTDEQVLYK